MTRMLLALVALSLTTSSAWADGRRVFGRVVNKRPAAEAPAAPAPAPAAAPASGALAPAPAAQQSGVRAAAPTANRGIAPSRGIVGRGGMRRDDDGSSDAPRPWATPGAFLRTEGLGFRAEPGTPAGTTHEIQAGSRITYEEQKGLATTNHKGAFQGPRDTPPNPNGWASGQASGRNGITELNVNNSGGGSAPGVGNGNDTPRGNGNGGN